jgi:hypothetical protein
VDRPKIVTLCGSSRFPDAFELATLHLSMRGHIVVGLSAFAHADRPQGARFLLADADESRPEKRAIDELHFRKIDLADEIFVVNPGGYIGSSTQREIEYAAIRAKRCASCFPGTNRAPRVWACRLRFGQSSSSRAG